jgi:hypothetical protein
MYVVAFRSALFFYNIKAYSPLSVIVSFFAEQFLPDLSYDKDFPAISSFRVQFIVKPQWSYRRILANDEGVPRNFQRNIFLLGVLYCR